MEIPDWYLAAIRHWTHVVASKTHNRRTVRAWMGFDFQADDAIAEDCAAWFAETWPCGIGLNTSIASSWRCYCPSFLIFIQRDSRWSILLLNPEFPGRSMLPYFIRPPIFAFGFSLAMLRSQRREETSLEVILRLIADMGLGPVDCGSGSRELKNFCWAREWGLSEICLSFILDKFQLWRFGDKWERSSPVFWNYDWIVFCECVHKYNISLMGVKHCAHAVRHQIGFHGAITSKWISNWDFFYRVHSPIGSE